jgi:hypothetical protein
VARLPVGVNRFRLISAPDRRYQPPSAPQKSVPYARILGSCFPFSTVLVTLMVPLRRPTDPHSHARPLKWWSGTWPDLRVDFIPDPGQPRHLAAQRPDPAAAELDAFAHPE